MGTRGAYGFYKDGQNKLTYNHFDSYPEGLGNTVVDFCRATSRKEMDDIFDRIILVHDTNLAVHKPTQEQIEECERYFDNRVSTGQKTEWYALLREAQGNLDAYKHGLRYMIDNERFMQDSLFCEWAYVINLTDGLLEVYRGFQKTPQNNRYLMPFCFEEDDDYFNVALLVAYPLDGIPDNWVDEVYKLAEEREI